MECGCKWFLETDCIAYLLVVFGYIAEFPSLDSEIPSHAGLLDKRYIKSRLSNTFCVDIERSTDGAIS